MTRRYYSSAAAATALDGSITSGATSITVGAITGFPVQYPYTLIIDPETASEEVVTVTAGAGTTLTVERGSDGTTALAHTTGAVVKHGVSARDFEDPAAHAEAEHDVHGVDGDVVGTTDTQTLTGKTISTDSNTINGLPTSSFAVTDGAGKLDGSAAQKVIPAGAVVGTTDTQTLTNKTLTAPRGDVARGYLDHAEVTTDSNGVANSGSGVVDITGLEATINPGASRKVRVMVQVQYALSTTAATCSFYIREGATILARVDLKVAAEDFDVVNFSAILEPTDAAHTYKVSLSTTAGTLRQSGDGSGDYISSIYVEDIGEA